MNRNSRIGQKVQWRTGKKDDWKSATIVDKQQYMLTDDQVQNEVCFQQSKAFLLNVSIESIDCAAEDERRFRANAILDATIYPVERNENPQWGEPKCNVTDIPIVVVDGCAYVIAQILEAAEEGEFKCDQLDLAILLAVMFQPP